MTDTATADKLAIRDVINRYCRGLDRMDKTMARSVFSEDCRALYHGMYEGTGHGFIEWAWEAHEALDRHSHQMTTVLIQLDGDRAVSETYGTITLWASEPEPVETCCRSRYYDRWEKRDGQWLIVEREHILDGQSANGVPLESEALAASRRDGEDASFRFFPPEGAIG